MPRFSGLPASGAVNVLRASGFAGLVLLALCCLPALASTFVVNSTGNLQDLAVDGVCDTGQTVGAAAECTLRAAIEEANSALQPAEITFAIEACPQDRCVIDLAPTAGGVLPQVERSVLIDGSTQPGNEAVCQLPVDERPAYRIILTGGGEGTGIAVGEGVDGTVIRGLNVRNFDRGVDFIGSSNGRLECSFIGSDENGLQPGPGNRSYGVLIACDATGQVIGGADPELGNLISANGVDGMKIYAGFTCNPDPEDNIPTNNSVAGNYIGLAASGTEVLGNTIHGLSIYGGVGAHDNFVGLLPESGLINGNVIGGNGGSGIYIDTAPHETATTRNTVIVGNAIGTDMSGALSLGNGLSGVEIRRGSETRIGGALAAEANRIAFNSEGVYVAGATSLHNRIQGNSFYSNTGLGIELIADEFDPLGVTPNDPEDLDDGPNGLQNYPELATATAAGSGLVIEYAIPTRETSLPLTVAFYLADPDRDEGERLLGTTQYDQLGSVSAWFDIASSLSGAWLTATASDSLGNTSEFSQAIPVEIIDPIFSDRFSSSALP